MNGYHSVIRRGARIVFARGQLERQLRRDRQWIRDQNGNIYQGYLNNRAGRRRFARSSFGKMLRDQPLDRPVVTCRRRRSALLVALAALACGLSVSAPARATPRLTRAQIADLISGRARLSGGAAASFYVRKTGSDSNGGSSAGTSPDATNTDGVTNGTSTFTSAGANFQPGDVDKLINIVGKGRYRITARGSTTSITLSGSPSAGSTLTYNVGGAVLTVGALMANANAALVSGDTVYVGAGAYREVNTLQVSGVSWLGDVDGAKTGDSGMVQLTAFTTNDKTTPSSSALLTFAGKINLTFKNIDFVNGGGQMFDATTTTSTGCSFTYCSFTMGNFNQTACTFTTVFGTSLNLTFDSCYIYSGTSANWIQITLPGSSSGADYNANVLFKNCIMLGANWCLISGSSSQFKGGGVNFYNSTHLCANSILSINTGSSPIYPCKIFGCFMYGGEQIIAATVGNIYEDYNVIVSGNSYDFSVTLGAHTVTSYAPMIHRGQEAIWGGRTRPIGEPLAGSPLLGFENGADLVCGAAGTAANDTGVGTLDFTNVTNAQTLDGVFATASLAQNVVTHYAKLTNYGFAVPSDATIVGIIATGYAKAGTTNRIQDQNVKIVKGGTIGGTDKGTASNKLTAAITPQTWGGTSDLWGNTLTPSDVNGSTFGIAVAYKNTNATTTVVSLDAVTLAVFYTSPSGALSVDIRSATRPAGGVSSLNAAGAFERGNTGAKESSTVHTGSNCVRIDGPGYQDFLIPVDAASTTFTIYARYDSTYDATTGRPQVILQANQECGVAAQTVTCTTSALNAWEQQTIGPFTPTSKGVVCLRCYSRDVNGGGKAFFDTFAAS